jgi:hypothetical protein
LVDHYGGFLLESAVPACAGGSPAGSLLFSPSAIAEASCSPAGGSLSLLAVSAESGGSAGAAYVALAVAAPSPVLSGTCGIVSCHASLQFKIFFFFYVLGFGFSV